MASAITGSTTRTISRARARRKPRRDALGAAAFSCCGENRTTVSAIALLRMSRCLALDRLPQVLFHAVERREQGRDLGRLEPGQRRSHQLLAELAQALEQRPRRRRQV